MTCASVDSIIWGDPFSKFFYLISLHLCILTQLGLSLWFVLYIGAYGTQSYSTNFELHSFPAKTWLDYLTNLFIFALKTHKDLINIRGVTYNRPPPKGGTHQWTRVHRTQTGEAWYLRSGPKPLTNNTMEALRDVKLMHEVGAPPPQTGHSTSSFW